MRLVANTHYHDDCPSLSLVSLYPFISIMSLLTLTTIQHISSCSSSSMYRSCFLPLPVSQPLCSRHFLSQSSGYGLLVCPPPPPTIGDCRTKPLYNFDPPSQTALSEIFSTYTPTWLNRLYISLLPTLIPCPSSNFGSILTFLAMAQ